jgi:hypothetical protein
MGIPSGPWYVGDLLTFTVTTHAVQTGIVTDADSAPSYRVYEDQTGTAILNATMAKLDDTNTIGFYSAQLTLSAANGFEVGKSYAIYVNAITADVQASTSLNFKVIANPVTEEIYEGRTLPEIIKLMSAVLLGKASGLNTFATTFRDINDTVNRVSATVDADGNRLTVTYNDT